MNANKSRAMRLLAQPSLMNLNSADKAFLKNYLARAMAVLDEKPAPAPKVLNDRWSK